MSAIAEKSVPTVPNSVALTPMEMIREAASRGNMEVVSKLMDLQERWEKNQARKAFDAAISAAKAEIKPIARTTPGYNSKKYADFAAIARSVDPIISKHGLSYRFRSEQGERINVTCILSHKDGHSEETTLSGPADNTGNKNAIQAIGSTLTYLQRYSLVQMLGLSAAEDDDARNGARKVEGDPISQEQADAIIDLLESKGAPRDKFLEWVQKSCPLVQAIQDIPAPYYDSCVEKIKSFGGRK